MASIEVHPTAEALTEAAAERFVAAAASAVRARRHFAVALSGGSTPQRLFARLASDACAKRVDWAGVHLFWGDERCVPPDDPASNFGHARELLLSRVPLPDANVHRIRGEDEPAHAASAYERVLREAFATPQGPPVTVDGRRFDLVLLGMGGDGHTASLFPGGHAVAETERWVVVADHAAQASPPRVTLTPIVINAAAQVVFLVTGPEKAAMLRRVLDGADLPARAIAPRQGTLAWMVDAAAARASG